MIRPRLTYRDFLAVRATARRLYVSEARAAWLLRLDAGSQLFDPLRTVAELRAAILAADAVDRARLRARVTARAAAAAAARP